MPRPKAVQTKRRSLRLSNKLSSELRAVSKALGMTEHDIIRNALIKELNLLSSSLSKE